MGHWKLGAKLIALLIFLLGFSGICFGEDLSVTLLNVGQADSILIQTADKRVLIDAGEAKKQAYEILKSKSIDRLDLVVATHPHDDHIGGMQAVVDNIAIKVYMDNGRPHTTTGYSNLMESVENKVMGGMRYIVGKQGQRLNFGKEAHFEVLWPDEKGIQGSRSDINANSIILKLVHGDVCFAFMGDAEAETEQAVAPLIGSCQVLKVSHHGSPHSSTPVLLNTLKPKIALISAGLANKHGHPGQATLAALTEIGAQIYRTDLMGEITAISDGKSVRVVTEHAPLTITKININLASEKVLQQLPGVGAKTAQSIIEYREANGPFKTLDEVYKSNPKQKKRIDKIMPFITLEGGSVTGLVEQPQPSPVQPVHAPSLPSARAATASPNAVNINTADAKELMALPKIGEKTANAIIEYRNANGAFQSCADLSKVKGIGAKTVEKIGDQCTVH